MNSDSHSRVPQLLQNLIIHFFPPNTKDDVILKYLSYFTRILSSRLKLNTSQDLGTLYSSVKKQIISTYENQSINNLTVNAALSRNEELTQKFDRARHITNKYSILYVLLELSKFNNNGSGALLDLTKKNGSKSIGGIEAIFKSKEIEKVNRSLNTTSASAMELESNTASTMYSTAKKEKENQLMQTIKTVTNKGNSSLNLTEADLIRDLLFVFQGINGHALTFNEREECFQLRVSIPIPEPSRKIINSLCELGWLFKKTTDFLDKPCHGQIRQSLNIAVKEELNEYYRLLAVLENIRARQAEEDGTQASQALSLRKLALWTIEPLERLKWLCVLTESVAPLIGGNVISSIYAYKFQGSPATQALVSRILNQVLQPFLKFVKEWVYLGELNDKSEEFFIREEKDVNDENLWRKKYKIIGESIPSFIDQDIAEMIMTTGKSVNFLKRCCDVKDWILDIPPFETGTMLSVDSTEKGRNLLKEWITEATNRTNDKLVEVIFKKYHFLQNMESIKKYLLMGQGDFIQNLMDQISNELSKKANMVYRHNLLGIDPSGFMETAIRSSNAQYHNPDFLGRLDIKLLEPSRGDIGWDIFSLYYHVSSPLNCILHLQNMNSYLRIFNILWRVKRVEHTLSNVWIQHSSRVLSKMKGIRYDFNKFCLLRNEMIHFTSNLFNYIMVEVIESSWRNFVEEVTRAKDLSEIIRVHDNFLNSVLDRALLTDKYEELSKQLMRIFDLIFMFKYSQEILINNAQDEYKRETSLKNKKEMIDIIGKSMDVDDSDTRRGFESKGRFSQELIQNFYGIKNDYKAAFYKFKALLDKEDNTGKLRFLIFRLDFNEYYSKNKPIEKGDKLDKFSRSNNMSAGGGTGFILGNIGGYGVGSEIYSSNESNFFERKQDLITPNSFLNKEPARKPQNIEIESFMDKTASLKKPDYTTYQLNKPAGLPEPNLGNKNIYDSIFKKEMEEEEDEFLQEGEDEELEEEDDQNDYGYDGHSGNDSNQD